VKWKTSLDFFIYLIIINGVCYHHSLNSFILLYKKIMSNPFLLKYNPTMSPQDFVEANADYFVEMWLDNNPHLAYMINDWDLDKFYDDLDRDLVNEIILSLKK
jgi:hypothetical protein